MTSALARTYARIDLAFLDGEGAWLAAEDGRRYLDFVSGVAVTCLGHRHPHLVATLKAAADRVWHTSNLFRIPEQERLAERLTAASFADQAFFCNSGAEALEGAIKMARKHHYDSGRPERHRIIACPGAFHGRTLATLAAAGNEKYLAGYEPRIDGFDHVAYGNLNELRAAIGPHTGAILIEPVQGEGGVRPASLDYLRGVRAVCDEFGLLMMLDEVQTGMGRSGRLFAHEWAEVEPDILATAKGLGGGFPVGAVLAKANVAAAFTPGAHGTTFGGNPLAMAVANAVLDVLLEPGFLDGVDRIARVLWDRLSDVAARHPELIAELRGAGLLLGMKTHVPNTELQAALRARGLLVATAGDNVVRLLPPLIIDEEHVDFAVAAIEDAAAELGARGRA